MFRHHIVEREDGLFAAVREDRTRCCYLAWTDDGRKVRRYSLRVTADRAKGYKTAASAKTAAKKEWGDNITFIENASTAAN